MNATHTCLKTVLSTVTMLFTAIPNNASELPSSFQIKFENQHVADSIINSRPDLKFERIIPFAPNQEIESRHRANGLHLWYRIETPSPKSVETEVRAFSGKKGIRHVQPTTRIMLPRQEETEVNSVASQHHKSASATQPETAPVVNDPLYHYQWHYSNPEYANINLEKAWEIENGKRNVIVAVMDGQIDYNHPDLASNIWVNEAELNGLPGVDDDGNGYIDDIHGVTFFTDGDFSNHATHIAGTIAAVNNNGIGVCGIAGGNGKETGVHVMSIGITNGKGNSFIDDWSILKGYVYAADNGAVISSNSWCNITGSSPIQVDAINYFIKNAGKYDGSPMNGGLVIFAAGNENSEIAPGPINNPDIERSSLITVGATSSSGLRSSFSNYGYWIDIAAPGGDYDAKGVYSTYPDGKYGYMNGTSMACPHVSGAAALVVSRFQGSSLTPTEVKRILIDSSAPIDPLQAGYTHINKMGHGLLDVYSALQSNPQKSPDMPSDMLIYRLYGGLKEKNIFKWKVPTDGNGNAVAYLAIYDEGSDTPIMKVKTSGYEAGKEFCVNISGSYLPKLESFRFKSIDVWGNESPYTDLIKVKDESTDCPIIWNTYNTDNFVMYRPTDKYDNPININEIVFPYIQTQKGTLYTLTDVNKITKINTFNGDITLTFDVTDNTPLGTYPFSLRLAENGNPDNYTELNLSYTILEKLMKNEGPKAIDPQRMHFVSETPSGAMSINLREYIYDPQGLDFVIPDEEYDLTDHFFYDRLDYKIEDEIITINYSFIEDDFTDIYEACVTVNPYNSYFVSSSIPLYIHYQSKSDINDISSDTLLKSKVIYTLTGNQIDLPISQLSPGFYIIDGKKVLIK